jgi:hypothetical protein
MRRSRDVPASGADGIDQVTTIRDRITRIRARTPREDYPTSMAVHRRRTDPTTLSGTFGNTTGCTKDGRNQPRSAYAGSRFKLCDALGRHRPKCQPSSHTGENPPYGMIGGGEETSASFEAGSAPRSYPTAGRSAMSVPIYARQSSRGQGRGVGQHRQHSRCNGKGCCLDVQGGVSRELQGVRGGL